MNELEDVRYSIAMIIFDLRIVERLMTEGIVPAQAVKFLATKYREYANELTRFVKANKTGDELSTISGHCSVYCAVIEGYVLHEYTEKDFKNPELFHQDKTCFLCGHHIPIIQSLEVLDTDSIATRWIHSDPRICLSLTLKHDLRGK